MGRDVQIYNSTQQKNTLADVQAAISWRECTSYPTPINLVKRKRKTMPNGIRQKIMNLFKTYTSLSGENLRSRFMGAELDHTIKDLLKEGYLTRKIGAIPEKGYVYALLNARFAESQ